MKDQYFDLKGLSAYSAIAVPTLRDHIRSKRLPYFKIKGKILVRRSEFDAWVEKFRVNREQDLEGIVEEVLAGLEGNKSDKQFEGHQW